MRIGIDARFLTHPQHGGFKTYTECLVGALSRVDSENEYVLYVDRQPGPETVLPKGDNFRVASTSGGFPLLGMPWREQVQLSRLASRDRLDVFHAPCLSAPLFLSCPLVVTVHDMIWNAPFGNAHGGSESARRRLMHFYYRTIPSMAIRRAAAVLTVSETSKREIVEGLGLPGDRVVVTYEAARSAFKAVADASRLKEIRARYELPPRFILAMGAADPRKNLHTLISAFALVPEALRAEYPLVLMLGHGALARHLEQRAASHGLHSQVLLRRLSPSDAELACVYSAASLFVFPSLQEGFGLPPLEAMACGVPVVSASNSSMPEVLGDAALYADAGDPAGMAAAMIRVLSEAATRDALRKKGLRRTAQFSWETCACETLAVYSRVCNSNRHPKRADDRAVSQPTG